MGKKKLKETRIKQERIIYKEGIPEQIIEMLDGEVYRQYHIWDEMIKRSLQLHPELILAVIEEKFDKIYEKEVTIEYLTVEYALDSVKKDGRKVFRAIYTDIVLKVAGKDIYHLECQIYPNKEMKVRMYEYDNQIAMVHRERFMEQMKEEELVLPYSVILYLTHTKNTPNEEKLQVKLPNGDVWKYEIPVLKVQEYSLEEIKSKKLYFLIPLTVIRFYSKTTKKKREKVDCSLTQFLNECIIIVKEAVKNGHITEKTGTDILDFLGKGCYYLFAQDIEALEEVEKVIGPAFRFEREIWEEEITEEVTERVTKQVTEQVTQDGIRKMIRSLKTCNVSKEGIKKQLMIEYELSEAEAEEKIKLYFQ